MSNPNTTFFIKNNVAPYAADHIGVFDAVTHEKIGKVELGNFKPFYVDRKYRFGILSDVHRQSDQTTENAADLQHALEFFNNKESVEFTVICGDISQLGSNAEFQLYRNSVDTYSPDTSVYTTTGNHDCIQGGNPIDSSNWRSHVGTEKTFELTMHGDHFLFLGMTRWSMGSNGTPYDNVDITWLEDKIAEYKGQRCFIITHLFFPEYSGNFKQIYPSDNWLGGEQLYRLKHLIDNNPNTVWFNGHSHWMWWLQEHEDKANVYKPKNGGWAVHIPSCASPITSDGTSTRVTMPEESQAAIIDVYDKYIDVRGLDVKRGEYVPIAQYRLQQHLEMLEEEEEEVPYTDVDISHIVTGQKFMINDAEHLFDPSTQSLLFEVIMADASTANQNILSVGENVSEWRANCMHIVFPASNPSTGGVCKDSLRFYFNTTSGPVFDIRVPYVKEEIEEKKIRIAFSKYGIYVNSRLVVNTSGTFGHGIYPEMVGLYDWINMIMAKKCLIGSQEGPTRSSGTYTLMRIYDGQLTEAQLRNATSFPSEYGEDANYLDYLEYSNLDVSGITPGQKWYLNSSANYIDLDNQTVYVDLTGDLESTDQGILSLGTAIPAWQGGAAGANLHIFYPKADSAVNNLTATYTHIEVDLVTNVFARYLVNNIQEDARIKIAISKRAIAVNGMVVVNKYGVMGSASTRDKKNGTLYDLEAWFANAANGNLLLGSQEGLTRSWATYHEARIYNIVLDEAELAEITKL